MTHEGSNGRGRVGTRGAQRPKKKKRPRYRKPAGREIFSFVAPSVAEAGRLEREEAAT